MKVVACSKGNIQKLMSEQQAPYSNIEWHIMPDTGVDSFVKEKLLRGFECAILSVEQFAINELVPKFIKP